MTTTATPAQAGAEAQVSPDANTTDNIIDNAATEPSKETPEAEQAEPKEPEAPKPEEFSKKAKNALSYRDKKIGKLSAQVEFLQQQLSQRQAPEPSQKKDGPPKEADFTSYADFLEAKNAYAIEQKLEQKFSELNGKQQETQRVHSEQARLEKSLNDIGTAADKFIAETPDAQTVFDECEETLAELPASVKRVFLEIGPGVELAVYNLAKEGKLEELASMTPAQVAAQLGRAMSRAVIPPKTKAPAPLPAARGSVPSTKSLDAMSGHELLKWVKSK